MLANFEMIPYYKGVFHFVLRSQFKQEVLQSRDQYGSLLALIQARRKGPHTEEHFAFLLSVISFLFFILIVVSFYGAQKIPFSPFQLVWQKRQYVYLAGYYVLFFCPLLLGEVSTDQLP